MVSLQGPQRLRVSGGQDVELQGPRWSRGRNTWSQKVKGSEHLSEWFGVLPTYKSYGKCLKIRLISKRLPPIEVSDGIGAIQNSRESYCPPVYERSSLKWLAIGHGPTKDRMTS